MRGKIPIIVGGTHYYIDALLFQNTIIVQETPNVNSIDDASKSAIECIVERYNDFTNRSIPTTDAFKLEMHTLLKELDPGSHNNISSLTPDIAGKYHLNNDRKVFRSLQVFLESGKRHSSIMTEQKSDIQTTMPRYDFNLYI
jgi:tRNA dimethylallyltransferase